MHIHRVALATAALFAAPSMATPQSRAPLKSQFWAFAAPWDARSDTSIRAHATELSAVVTGWIGLDSVSGRPLLPSPYADTAVPRGARVNRMAIVTSWHGQRFHPASIRTLARNARELSATAGSIARYARAMAYTGLVLDFEDLEPTDLDGQLRVVKAIADSARQLGVRTIAIAVPATDTAAYPGRRLLAFADAIIPMLYDQHWAGGEPGPISSPDWVRTALALRIAEVGPRRIIAGLPTYGYAWRKGRPTETVGFHEAQQQSASASVPLRRDVATGTLHAVRGDWDLWVTDAVLLRSIVRQSEFAGIRRFALWRLGLEDPAIWRTVVR
ncbi:MAG TPA: hypothetical protein VFT29_20150 [Gemmatimonadaceae bacterium]|nr:hypothetical protein [Gemmatimonadaceae bacterium]